MDTTSLFVEIIIAGIQGLAWIVLMVLCLVGSDSLSNLKIQGLNDWVLPFSFIFLTLAYTLGIFIDRIADSVFFLWDKKIQKTFSINEKHSVAFARFSIQNEFVQKQLDYIRTRLRIARASAINFSLIAIFGIVFIMRNTALDQGQKWLYGSLTLGLGIMLVALSIYSWFALTNGTYKIIKTNFGSSSR